MIRILAMVLSILVAFGGCMLQPPSAQASAEIDPHLQTALAQADGSSILTAILSFSHAPSDSDLAAVKATGALAHRFNYLPMIAVRGTAAQIEPLLTLPGLVSAYMNREITYLLAESVPYIGADRVWNDLGYTGKGVTVAVLDSGIDAGHPDLASRVKKNVKVVDPLVTDDYMAVEATNTDTTSGHGTHVAGTIAGTGAASNGLYKGVAPDASLVGVGVGDGRNLLFVMQGFDWIGLYAVELGINVVSNSWGTDGAYSPNDPVNIATKKLHDDFKMAIVFASGNSGPGQNTLNPYSVAPWVIGVANGTKKGLLANTSSRGVPGDPLLHPTITAPGSLIVAARAVTGVTIAPSGTINDALGCTKVEYEVYYTCISGTSMATPHISGVIALMMEARPGLHPDILKQVLVDTARPMTRADGTPYEEWEVGAGYVDAYAAVARAKDTGYQKGQYKDPKSGKTYETYAVTTTWSGTVLPSVDPALISTDTHTEPVGADAVSATVKITWTDTIQDLDLFVYAPDGSLAGKSAAGFTSSEETSFSGDPLASGSYQVVTQGWLNVVTPYEGSITVHYLLK